MRTKFLIIAGAGCTLSDAKNVSVKKKPPLDKGFFKDAARFNRAEFSGVRKYLLNTYDLDPTVPEKDSLEAVMAMLYTDIHNPQLEGKAIPAFRQIIKLFNRRIAETTNTLKATNRFNLYRIICQIMDRGIRPEEICVITFNQDLQIEKVLQKIQSTQRPLHCGRIFNFPFCYDMEDYDNKLSIPRGKNISTFQKGDQNDPTLRILKLHGSLNWYSVHNSTIISKQSILSTSRKLHITPRVNITLELTFTRKRTKYTFPLIIPPVTHKAGILHQDIMPIWSKAETALKQAQRILVFGYSCPEMDFESANLLRRTVPKNNNLKAFFIIDPEARVFQRYAELTQLDSLYYFRTPKEYLLRQGNSEY